MGRKLEDFPPLGEREPESPSNTMSPGPRFKLTSVPSGILIYPAVLATKKHVPKVGGYVPLFGGQLGPYLAQCGLGRGLPPYQVAS